MRTRIMSKLTNKEVEEYLDRNDIIFVPVGTVELHGKMPLDVEYTVPLAIACEMAEKTDGLVLDGLKYFYCGATTNGRGTVQMSCSGGYHYLKELAYSLMCQGFKRQIYLTGHGPSYLTLGPLVADFFDETKLNICWMDQIKTMTVAASRLNPAVHGVENFNLLTYGAYELLNQKDDLLIEPELDQPNYAAGLPDGPLPESMKHVIPLIPYGNFECSTGFYFGSIEDHGGDTGSFRSIEERDAICAEGLKQLKVMVELADMPTYVEELRQEQIYTQTVVKEKYHHFPKMRFSEWT